MKKITCVRAEQLITAFSGKKIVVIGDIVVDHYVHGRVDRINPEAPAVPLIDVQEEEERTGGAGNVAKNLAQLGAHTTLLGVVGDDELAERVLALTQREGYTARLLRDASRPTIKKVRFVVNSQQLLRVDYEKTEAISRQLEDELLAYVTEAVTEGIDGMIISDYAKGTITQRVATECIALARQHNTPIAADVKLSRVGFIKQATFISPNLKEAKAFAAALGAKHAEAMSPYDLAKHLHEALDTVSCITLSADGMFIYASADEQGHVPPKPAREVFDNSGAGDTAIAVLLLARVAGATYMEAGQLANAAGAFVVGKVGTVGLSQEDVHTMVCDHDL